MMRTTLDIDDDVLALARTLADEKGISLGSAVSELIRRGRDFGSTISEYGFPVFDSPADAPPITPKMVQAALDDS